MFFPIPNGVYSIDQNSKDPNFEKAVKYFYQKKFEMAELMLQEVIKKDPENSMAYSYLGDIFLEKKIYDGALGLYKKAIDLDPANSENYFRLGQVNYYKKLGNVALENFKKSLELDKNLKIAHYHLGLTYLMLMRDKKNTIESWEHYIRLAPEDQQYESIKRVIELLKDPNFFIPPLGGDITIEEALLLGGGSLSKKDIQSIDKKAGHESKKTKEKIEEVYTDDDL